MQFYKDITYDRVEDIDKDNKYKYNYYYTSNEKDEYYTNNELEKYEEKYKTFEDVKYQENNEYLNYMLYVTKKGISNMLKEFFNPSEKKYNHDIKCNAMGYVHLYNIIKKLDKTLICDNEIKDFIICGLYYAENLESINYIKEVVKKNEWHLSRQELIEHCVSSEDYGTEICLINVFHEAVRMYNIEKINALCELGLLSVYRDNAIGSYIISGLCTDTVIEDPSNEETIMFAKRLIDVYNITKNEILDSIKKYNYEIETKNNFMYKEKILEKDYNIFLKTLGLLN